MNTTSTSPVRRASQDNSAVTAFDPEKAKQELDAPRLAEERQFREKDGRQLVIRDVFFDSLSTRQIAQVAQNGLAQIGVKLDLVTAPGWHLVHRLHHGRQLRHRPVLLVADPFALSALTQIFASGGESNFGKIDSPRIDAQIEKTLDELDPAKARHLWPTSWTRWCGRRASALPLFQSAGNSAVRSTLAELRARGLGDLDYSKIGFILK